MFPIPDHIMEANPTKKLRLPDKATIILKHNIVLPITSPQQLTNTARLLRKDYYFTRLPEEWLDITTNNKKGKT